MFFAFSHAVYANLEITEVNYNPEVKANHLWIKVFNNTSDEVDLTMWSVADYDGTSWHYHAINADGASILPSNSYAVIAKASSTTIDAFKSKNLDISDQLFYGNLTIEDEGVLGLSNDKKTVISNKSYGGASAFPDTSTNNDTSESNNTNTGGSTSSSSSPKEETKIYNIITKIISPKIVTAGVPFTIDHNTTGTKKEKIILGKFVWNFGDGMKREVSVSDPFSYIYEYPGEYVLTLSFYDSSFDVVPDAIDRLVLKVIPSGIVISSVGTYADPFIEIMNNSSYEMSLRGLVVKGSVHSFIIPEGMIILPNKKLKLSPKITGFDSNDLISISIVDTSGQVFATYPRQNYSSVKYSNSPSPNGSIVKSESIINNELGNKENSPEIINLNDLGASAVSSDSLGSLGKGFYSWFGLVFIITVGIASVILLRRKEEIPDYVEETISAKDMTIIE
jgi:hypothetical protein